MPGKLKTFLLAALLWTALAVVFATQLYFAGLPWPVALAWSIPRWYAWGAITPAIFWLDRRIGRSASFPARVALHIPLGVMWTTVSILLRLATRPLRAAPVPMSVAEFQIFFLERFYSDLLIYAVLAAASMSRDYARQLRERERQAQQMAVDRAELERNLIEARLQGLRAQLQPHFLFNALNTINAFTESDPPKARRLIEQLGSLLRASLAHGRRPFVTLAEELTFLDDYLSIESARFAGRIVVTVDADDSVMGRAVPSFLLQPLVENAIRHGVSSRLSGGRVEVTARPSGDDLVLSVRDDGVGMPPDWSIETHAGIGLRNVAARLEQLCGRRDLLDVVHQSGGGVAMVVTIPATPRAVV